MIVYNKWILRVGYIASLEVITNLRSHILAEKEMDESEGSSRMTFRGHGKGREESWKSEGWMGGGMGSIGIKG